MDPINIPQMLAYIPYMNPMGNRSIDRDTDKIYNSWCINVLVDISSGLTGNWMSIGFW